jgi:hypothetical protein
MVRAACNTNEDVQEAVISLTNAAVDRHLLSMYPAINIGTIKILFMIENSIKKNNLHEQLHHITKPLISLCVIQTHGTVFVTYCDQRVDSCRHNAAHNLRSQANLHHIVGTRLNVSFGAAGDKHYVCQLYVASTCWPK